MSRYVPPALRGKQASAVDETPAERKAEDGYSSEEICNQFDYKTKPGTLNGGNQLAFIMLFSDQHPQWPPRIFCKSNLQLLSSNTENPEDASRVIDPEVPPPSHPIHESDQLAKSIPVFIQDPTLHMAGHKKREPIFVVDGMYTISAVEYVEPRSEELIKMLDIKFGGGKQRSAESWNQSLTMRWAVVDLQKDDTDKTNPMVPLKLMKKKGVTEMLEEMRLKEAKKTQEGGTRDFETVATPENTGSPQQLNAEKQV